MAAKVLSLPELMQSIGDVPDDPMAQAEKVKAIYNSARQAEWSVIDHHGAAVATDALPRSGGEKYDRAHHDRHIAGVLKHYPKV